METDRRTFVKAAGIATVACGAISASGLVSTLQPTPFSLHWPGPDIHVDLDAIRTVLEPEWRARAVAAKTARELGYGAAIAKLRAARGIKQSEISGLSERQVRRIEKGEGTTYESLQLLAAAHGMGIDEYLREVAQIAREVPSEERQLVTA